MTFFPDPRRNPEAAAVVARFRTKNFDPVGYTLFAYGAVQVWALAVEQAGTFELNAVIAALRSRRFTTVLGEVGFDEKGDVTTSGFVWYVWKNGDYVLVP